MTFGATRAVAAPLSISSVSRNPETGTFRFELELDGIEVSADLTVAWLEEKREAWLRFITVDCVRRVDALHSDLSEGGRARAPGQGRGEAIQGVDAWMPLIEAWVRENERAVFEAALSAEVML